MSGTSPDRVKPPSGAQNSSPKGNPSGAQSGSAKKHVKAISLKNDKTFFGIEQVTIDLIKQNSTVLKKFRGALENALSNTVFSAEQMTDIKDNLVGICSQQQDEIKSCKEIYYEGRELHSFYIDFLREEYSEVTKVIDLLKMVKEGNLIEARREYHRSLSEQQNPDLGSTEKSKPENVILEGFGKKLVEKERPVENKFTWADLVQEELEANERDEFVSTKQSLTAVIRSRGAGQLEGRVEIPGNLEQSLPLLFKRMTIAARLAGCEIVKNDKIEINLARPDIFGPDEKARNDVLDTLYDEKGMPKKELLEVTDLSVLIDTLLEIPTAESLELTGPGRLGIHHTINLLMRVYCEQEFSTPIAKQRNWWKGGQALRSEMASRLANQLGGETPSNCILNAFDILYRKFIRKVLSSRDPSKVQMLKDLASEFSERLFNSGAALFTNLLRVETRTKKVETEVLQGKKTVKKVSEEKYRARIRPTITDGPKTPFESSIYAKVNTALAKVETLSVNYNLKSKDYASPNEWEDDHRSWIENLYSRARIPSSIMVGRKQAIRAAIHSSDRQKSAGDTGATPAGRLNDRKITPAEWTSLQDSYIQDNEENFDKASVKAINDFLGTTLNKEGLLKLSEADILRSLDF